MTKVFVEKSLALTGSANCLGEGAQSKDTKCEYFIVYSYFLLFCQKSLFLPYIGYGKTIFLLKKGMYQPGLEFYLASLKN